MMIDQRTQQESLKSGGNAHHRIFENIVDRIDALRHFDSQFRTAFGDRIFKRRKILIEGTARNIGMADHIVDHRSPTFALAVIHRHDRLQQMGAHPLALLPRNADAVIFAHSVCRGFDRRHFFGRGACAHGKELSQNPAIVHIFEENRNEPAPSTSNYNGDFWSEAVVQEADPVYDELRRLGPVVWMAQHDCWAVSHDDAVRTVRETTGSYAKCGPDLAGAGQ